MLPVVVRVPPVIVARPLIVPVLPKIPAVLFSEIDEFLTERLGGMADAETDDVVTGGTVQ